VIVGLDHVQVGAPPGAEDDARWFYGHLLGLPELEKPAGLRERGGVWFAAGAQGLHVGVAPDFAPATKAHPGLLVASRGALERLADRLAQAGVEPAWDTAIAGVRRCFVTDPWGNRIELLAPS